MKLLITNRDTQFEIECDSYHLLEGILHCYKHKEGEEFLHNPPFTHYKLKEGDLVEVVEDEN